MSKTKQKNRSETEHYRGIIREYEREIRSLRQQLKQYEKYERVEKLDFTEDDDTDSEETLLSKDCDCCGKGKVIQTLEILGKIYGTCNTCGTNDRIK